MNRPAILAITSEEYDRLQADNARLQAEMGRLTEELSCEKYERERAWSYFRQSEGNLTKVKAELTEVRRERDEACTIIRLEAGDVKSALDQRDAALTRITALEEAGNRLCINCGQAARESSAITEACTNWRQVRGEKP
jgi:chromosome segregation ATPase